MIRILVIVLILFLPVGPGTTGIGKRVCMSRDSPIGAVRMIEG